MCFGGKRICSDDQVSCVQVVDSYDQSNIHLSLPSGEGWQASRLLALVEGYRTGRPAATGGGLTVCAMEERWSLGVKRCAAAQDGEQANLFVGPGEPEPVEVNMKGVQIWRTPNFGAPRS